ncbi:D-alanyl-D-alanine carboxypeptidase [Jeotgalibacillus alimentarius]|uniref:serine-type D-Ala-D-Ala carboxypeptidase n=1 Tax=Jeotgalibacillus alimentarius TaxID=135826 RepID=A0A0C2S4Q0_9BACL|nr:D-alanyl-D-alanine carboxypeptidase [Jeotgalibacillus alimentarius]
MLKKYIFLFCLTLFICLHSQSSAAEPAFDNIKSGILIDADSGMVIYDQNSSEKLPPASMTKIATLLLIMEEVNSGNLKWDDEVTTSSTAAGMGGSQIYLKEGETMTVRELIKAISIASANDASVALAEHIAGNEETFVSRMNQKAEELGLKNTHFKNVTGLSEEGHVSSAMDMARLAMELLTYEEITEFTGTYDDYLRQDEDPFWLVNTNKLIRSYPGADGLKTGFTNEAKYCLTATAKRGDMRLISVVFGAPSSKERNQVSSEILNYGFKNYVTKTFSQKGDVLAEAAINKGSAEKIHAELKDSLKIIEKKNEKAQYTRKLTVYKKLDAPISKGQEVGYVSLQKNGKEISKELLISSKHIKKAEWMDLFRRSWKRVLFAE